MDDSYIRKNQLTKRSIRSIEREHFSMKTPIPCDVTLLAKNYLHEDIDCVN